MREALTNNQNKFSTFGVKWEITSHIHPQCCTKSGIQENNEKLKFDATLYISPEEWTGAQIWQASVLL